MTDRDIIIMSRLQGFFYSDTYCRFSAKALASTTGTQEGGNMYYVEAEMKTVDERFWGNIIKTDTCWLWMGCHDGCGYGMILVRGTRLKTHRYSWMLHNGEIPEGMHVCHTCDNPKCVNPAHLFLGTHLDNMRDMISKGRLVALPGEKNGRAKLTQDDIREIRIMLNSSIKFKKKDIAKQYGITREHLWCIERHKSWK
jgi:hypothetical protein